MVGFSIVVGAVLIAAILVWRPWESPEPTSSPTPALPAGTAPDPMGDIPPSESDPTETPTPTESPTIAPSTPTDTPSSTSTSPATATPPPTDTPNPTSTPTETPTDTPTPVPPRRIAYVSEEGGRAQIWLVDADGSNRRKLTTTGANFGPSWSLDNRYIYFVKQRGSIKSIARYDLHTDREEIVESAGGYDYLTVLLSGEIATVRQSGRQYQLVIGTNTIFTLDRRFDFHVSPDQTQVMIDPLDDPRALYTVGINGGQVMEVAGAKSWNGSWSPDGRMLYVSDRIGTAFLFVAARDGTGVSVIGPTDNWNQSPSWSPDGRWIGYVAKADSVWNLYRVAGDGSGRRRMARAVNPNKSPVWEPDSRRMAFESNRFGDWDIFTVDMNGHERQLTKSNANDYDPAWSH